jgi:hypothetical protein
MHKDLYTTQGATHALTVACLSNEGARQGHMAIVLIFAQDCAVHAQTFIAFADAFAGFRICKLRWPESRL